MNVLVGPLCRLIDLAPLLGTGVPAAGVLRRFLLKTVHDDAAKLLDSLGLRFLDPGRTAVGPVVRSPVMGAVYLVNGEGQIFV